MKFLIFLLALNACLLWCLLVAGLISRLLYWRQTRKPAMKQARRDNEYPQTEGVQLCPAIVEGD